LIDRRDIVVQSNDDNNNNNVRKTSLNGEVLDDAKLLELGELMGLGGVANFDRIKSAAVSIVVVVVVVVVVCCLFV
jgi:hypothetical protein